MIGIIDYGSGNLRSVVSAFRYLKQDVEVCEDPRALARARRIVLPGVGSSAGAMKGLRQRGLVEPLLEHISSGRPFLGICLGLQLLFTRSSEGGGCDCLDVVRGEVKLFPGDAGLKVPQIGWNTVKISGKNCPIFEGIEDETYFYFVHSYYCDNGEPECTAGVTEYGVLYTSVLWRANVFAVQFHPERSQSSGLKMLENFTRL
ncbi:MAG: imidazole glycerol phosphate synthase subunit HisH [Candidatus Makaraimicrobium thalassicum]|nr:MAG: imidazole glycerol phosphate synthase subunit HisH [Candidatus Omnitrophota bacterium]